MLPLRLVVLLTGFGNLLSAKILDGLAHNWVCLCFFSFCTRRCLSIGFGVSGWFGAWHISHSKGKSCCLFSSVLTSLPSGDLSRSGGWLGRLLYGLTILTHNLRAGKKYMGKISQLCLAALVCTHWCHFLLFFSPLMMAKSHWPAHDMLLSSGRGGKSGMSR